MLEKIMTLNILLYAMATLCALGTLGMLGTSLSYKRVMKHTERGTGLKDKWLKLWQTRDRLLHRMNRFVWYPTILCAMVFGLAVYLQNRMDLEGISTSYLYVMGIIPVFLMLVRQIMDFSYQEDLLMNSLADYVEELKDWVSVLPKEQREDPLLQDEIVEKITSSIRQTAATGSHFSRMLSPEEEQIMRDVIKEFME